MDQPTHGALRKRPWNMGQAGGAESAVEVEGYLGDPGTTADRPAYARAGAINLAIDSKLRSCDLVRLRMRDVCHGNVVASRTRYLGIEVDDASEISEQTEV